MLPTVQFALYAFALGIGRSAAAPALEVLALRQAPAACTLAGLPPNLIQCSCPPLAISVASSSTIGPGGVTTVMCTGPGGNTTALTTVASTTPPTPPPSSTPTTTPPPPPPTTATSIPASGVTTAPGADPTYVIYGVVSNDGTTIGDLDLNAEVAPINASCGSTGCSFGNPVGWSATQYVGDFWETLDGKFSIGGFAPNDEALVSAMVMLAVQSLEASKSCENKSAPACVLQPGKRSADLPGELDISHNDESHLNQKRDVPAQDGCSAISSPTVQKTLCSVANNVQITAYANVTGTQVVAAQLTINATSDPANPLGWLCSAIISAVSGLFTAIDLPKPLRGAITAGNAGCLGVINLPSGK